MLAHDALTLMDADDAALANGANLAMLGAEAIQFGGATPLGGGVWRLRDLWRGRGGTVSAIGGHGADEPFALIDGASMRLLDSEEALAGALIGAQGVGDASAVLAPITSADRALRPLPPACLRYREDTASWIRRSRDGFVWRDGIDVPLAEEREAYLVEASGGGTQVSAEVSTAQWNVPAGFGPSGTIVTVSVRQIGRHGLSDPGIIRFAL